MKLLRHTSSCPDFAKGTVATIGNFDGVHLGHQAILEQLKTKAKARGLASLLIIFEPQPAEQLKKASAPKRLSSIKEKINFLKQAGIDYLYCLRFDKKLADTPAEAFAEQILFSRCQIRSLLVGEDFRFGKQRLGDIPLLRQLALKNGAELDCLADFNLQGKRISSSLIRSALEQADLDLAKSYLGRAYSILGRVKPGQGLARTLVFPTANIQLNQRSLALPNGVYAVRVKIPSGHVYNGIANLGMRPTVCGQSLVLETHLFDFDDDLYGQRIEVCFLRYQRNEIRFPSLEALVAQIQLDAVEARQYFNSEAARCAEPILSE